jgi:DNA-binding SARP family transcriptional activator
VKHCRNGESLEFRGEREAAIAEHRAAEAIYQSEFLAEDRYEDWVMEKRQTLQELYLAALYRLSEHYLQQQDYDGCARICKAMLLVDGCNEEAHRRLMRCYCRLGQTHLAVRQYHFCVEALARRVQLSPSVETVELLRKIRQRALV